MRRQKSQVVSPYRRSLVMFLFLCAFIAVAARAVDLQVLNKQFLQHQGAARHLRTVKVPAHRGMILDRNGEPLAISTPIESVWANPAELAVAVSHHAQLEKLLGLKSRGVNKLLKGRQNREFVYLRRHVEPALADKIRVSKVPGVYLQREYRRYYPAGEVLAHIVGFTNIDDFGQEGLELAYNDWLQGRSGAKRVLKDGRQHIVKNVESIRAPQPGRDLVLSIDRRIQYLAYRELKAVVKKHKARSASIVTLDVRTGEVLAMVNHPSFNPNNRSTLLRPRLRNRAVTDVFEPGSTFKPLTVAMALESGKYRPDTLVDTAPGRYKIGANTVRDVRNFGMLDVAGIIQKSSNVGASKIALAMDPGDFWSLLNRTGFGSSTGSGFPGEAGGHLGDYHDWGDIEVATLSFGYGLSVTCLQLAQSYQMLAADGYRSPISFTRLDKRPKSQSVISGTTARQVRDMLELVVGEGGTGSQAQVPGYRVAGKTGTVRKAIEGGYAEDRYLSLFAGMAPASDPRLVTVVVVHEPGAGEFYGGKVAGPVFSRVMAGALRLMNVPPDKLVPRSGQQLHANLVSPE